MGWVRCLSQERPIGYDMFGLVIFGLEVFGLKGELFETCQIRNTLAKKAEVSLVEPSSIMS